MARRHALIRSAIAGTVSLWGTTIAMSLTEVGSDRLHSTILAGSFLAALVTAILIGFVAFRAFTARALDTVNTAVDELHVAVEEVKGKVLHFDRGFVVAARAMMAGLIDGTNQVERGSGDEEGRKAA